MDIAANLKQCKKCQGSLALTCFAKDKTTKDGLQYTCRKCKSAQWQDWRSRNNGKLKAYREENKEKQALYVSTWSKENRAKRNAQQKERRKSNPEQRREQERRHREGPSRAAWLEKKRRYARNNPEKVAMKRRFRAGVMAQACVAWSDQMKIRAFYLDARDRTERTGIEWQVDHIVPLQGDTVCGLHNEFNLRVVTAFENKSKKNKFLPELLAA